MLREGNAKRASSRLFEPIWLHPAIREAHVNEQLRSEKRVNMGGPSGAVAYASSPRATSTSERRQRLDAAVHSLRKTTQYTGNDHKHEHPEAQADGNNSDNDGFLSDGYADEDEDDDYEDFDADEVRTAAAAREQSEMKRHFNFQLEKRRSLKNHFMSAVHKKRRFLMRNENLRFRELYKPPEPMVLLIAVSLVTIVTLILTKSWPFYSSES